jgi:hypothetical protein
MDYPHSTPRYVHRPYGEMLHVETAADCADALADGWTLQPLVWPPEPRPVDVVDEPIAEIAADVVTPAKKRKK